VCPSFFAIIARPFNFILIIYYTLKTIRFLGNSSAVAKRFWNFLQVSKRVSELQKPFKKYLLGFRTSGNGYVYEKIDFDSVKYFSIRFRSPKSFQKYLSVSETFPQKVDEFPRFRDLKKVH
jgi:hypothetical protein